MLLSLPCNTPKAMLYLLTGSIPIRYQLKRRRLVYLHNILNRNENSLVRKVFEAQIKNRKKNDWATQILQDLKAYQILLSMDEIRSMPEKKYKNLIKTITVKRALNFLNKNQGSKCRKYENL